MDEIEKFQDVEHIQTEVKIAALQAMEKLKKILFLYRCFTLYRHYKYTIFWFFFTLYWFYLLIITFFLVLDPRLKLQYYRDNKWENKFIEGAQKDLNNLYKTSYASTESVVISDECPEDSLLQHIYKRRKATNDNELDQYLAAPVSLYGTDILNWWKVNVLYIIKLIILYYIYLYINFIYLFIYRVMKFNILV